MQVVLRGWIIVLECMLRLRFATMRDTPRQFMFNELVLT